MDKWLFSHIFSVDSFFYEKMIQNGTFVRFNNQESGFGIPDHDTWHKTTRIMSVTGVGNG